MYAESVLHNHSITILELLYIDFALVLGLLRLQFMKKRFSFVIRVPLNQNWPKKSQWLVTANGNNSESMRDRLNTRNLGQVKKRGKTRVSKSRLVLVRTWLIECCRWRTIFEPIAEHCNALIVTQDQNNSRLLWPTTWKKYIYLGWDLGFTDCSQVINQTCFAERLK